MKQSILQKQTEEFDDRNNFLYFILGLISFSQNVLHSFGLNGDGQPRSPETESEKDDASEDRDFLNIRLLR